MPKARFHNPWPHDPHLVRDILKWKLGIGRAEQPVMPAAPNQPAGCRQILRAEIETVPADSWRVAWLGHASFLVQGFGASILIDPIFSNHCSPIPIPSLRRKA